MSAAAGYDAHEPLRGELAVPDPIRDPASALAASAAVLARGGTLDARLDALAVEAAALAGGRSAVVYLLDGEQATLIPGGGAGLGEGGVAGLDTLSVGAADESGDPVARAVTARRAEIVTVTPEMTATLGAVAVDVGAIATLPLVTQDEDGTQAVQGLLAVAFAAGASPGRAILGPLAGVADLCAAAVHQARLQQALVERSEWLERVAHVDPLTGLTNRRTFDRMLEHELARAQRQGTALSLAIFDVDGLSAIDRDHGSDVADDVLRRVAATLADSVRLVDTVARYGGDEFALLAPGVAGRAIAERVTEAIGLLDPLEGAEAVSVSVGLARFPEDGGTGAELLAAADAALRTAKASGGAGIAEAGASA